MPSPTSDIDKTRRPRNSLLAFGILVAIAAVLIGFHGTTMVLSAMSLRAGAERTAALGGSQPSNIPAPPAKPAQPPADMDVDAVPPVANPTGIAAAAKAKAQAEMDAASEGPPASERPRFRAPKVELHKVY